jgi:tripartite-type tricarboxylate transporter receptor subunit TctC
VIGASTATAQGWPDRPVRLVVPFPPGGPTDLVARPLAQRLGEALGQPAIVENHSGAGGNLGAEVVAKAAPDGHTLLLSNVGVLAVNRFLYRSPAFDPERGGRSLGQAPGQEQLALTVRGTLGRRAAWECWCVILMP